MRARDTARSPARSSASSRSSTGLAGGFDAAEALALASSDDEGDGRVLVVGHEPDFSQVVYDLTGARVDMKKGGIAGVRLDGAAGRADRAAAAARAAAMGERAARQVRAAGGVVERDGLIGVVHRRATTTGRCRRASSTRRELGAGGAA